MYLVKYQFLKKLLAILLIVSIFYFLGAQLFKSWRELSNYDLKVNFTLLGISFILLSTIRIANPGSRNGS